MPTLTQTGRAAFHDELEKLGDWRASLEAKAPGVIADVRRGLATAADAVVEHGKKQIPRQKKIWRAGAEKAVDTAKKEFRRTGGKAVGDIMAPANRWVSKMKKGG